MKSNKLLFCCLTSLIPLILLNVWLNRHFTFSDSKITILLAALLTAQSLDWLLLSARGKFIPRPKPPYKGQTSLIKGITIIVNSPYYHYLTVQSKLVIMGILLLLTARLSKYVMFILIGMIPIEILSYKLLYEELLIRSKLIQEQTSGWQEVMAAADCPYDLNRWRPPNIIEQLKPVLRRYTSVASKGRTSEIRNRILHASSLIARATIIVLAVYDFCTKDLNPIYLVYGFLMSLFLSNLIEVIYGGLRKQDLLNSIHYIAELEKRLTHKRR